ncbi:uncharacterized protein LOC117116679 isoform X2 [Anneissia japonica]|uniref:uncharacterized protein LOC117116679 isoform X2 n=1 Tax=Anneissia japonica TaxID=1529436 RepID=UPI001425A205|nr:uncharacterized protein LOC117116679 isoform X2 [Anneissia japonica]
MDGPNQGLSKIFVKQDDPVYEELNIVQKPPECLQRTERQPSLPKPGLRSFVENFSESCAIDTFTAPVCPIERPPLPAPRTPSPAPRSIPDAIQKQIIADLARQVAHEASNKSLKPNSPPRCLNIRHSMHSLPSKDGALTWRKNAIRRKSDTCDLRKFQAEILGKRSPIDEKVTPINELFSTDQCSPSDDEKTNILKREQHRRSSTPPIPGPKPNRKKIAPFKRATTIE